MEISFEKFNYDKRRVSVWKSINSRRASEMLLATSNGAPELFDAIRKKSVEMNWNVKWIFHKKLHLPDKMKMNANSWDQRFQMFLMIERPYKSINVIHSPLNVKMFDWNNLKSCLMYQYWLNKLIKLILMIELYV